MGGLCHSQSPILPLLSQSPILPPLSTFPWTPPLPHLPAKPHPLTIQHSCSSSPAIKPSIYSPAPLSVSARLFYAFMQDFPAVISGLILRCRPCLFLTILPRPKPGNHLCLPSLTKSSACCCLTKSSACCCLYCLPPDLLRADNKDCYQLSMLVVLHLGSKTIPVTPRTFLRLFMPPHWGQPVARCIMLIR